jgi:hypothetical protein
MRAPRHLLAMALALALASAAGLAFGVGGVFAQDQKGPPPEPLKQIALTDKQIEAVLAAQKDIAAVMAKMPQGESGELDPKTMAQLDAVAKKYKFANYGEYDMVAENIGLVMDGVDPQTKKYVGADVMLKKQIAAVQADKTMAPKDKKEAIDQMTEQLKETPPIQNPGNIDLVVKYYDRLSAAIPQNE